MQLVAAVSSLTFVLVTGVKGLLGLGPAIFLVAAACTGAVAGRAMDRVGRRPVLIVGFIVGGTGCAVTALGTHVELDARRDRRLHRSPARRARSALLVRTAAGDMYPPLRRARGISYVLFGSVFGAILGPTVFSPLFAGKDVSADSLTVPWLAAAAISLVTAAIVSFVRPDTKKIAELIAPADELPRRSRARRSREIIRRPGVIPAMLTAFASFGVMVSVMNLTGYVVVEKHHHAQHNVFPIIGAHVLGMYALVLFVGALIDRVGRTPALASGLLVMGVSALGLGVDLERAGDGAAALRPRHRLEHLVRRGGRAARRPDAAVGARAALRLQRLRGGALRRRAGAARRADARNARRRRDGDRRGDPRHGPGALAPAASPTQAEAPVSA